MEEVTKLVKLGSISLVVVVKLVLGLHRVREARHNLSYCTQYMAQSWMTPSMVASISRVEQGASAPRRYPSSWCSSAWAKQPLSTPVESADSKFLMWIDHKYSAHLEKTHFQL